MNKKRALYFFLILILLTLLGAGCINANNTDNTGQVKEEKTVVEKAEITVNLVIDNGDKKESYNVTANENDKVIDVLQTASVENNLSLEIKDSSYGPMVQGLLGKSGGEGGKYWLYYVNGASATVGVGEQNVKEGDLIEFRFE